MTITQKNLSSHNQIIYSSFQDCQFRITLINSVVVNWVSLNNWIYYRENKICFLLNFLNAKSLVSALPVVHPILASVFMREFLGIDIYTCLLVFLTWNISISISALSLFCMFYFIVLPYISFKDNIDNPWEATLYIFFFIILMFSLN